MRHWNGEVKQGQLHQIMFCFDSKMRVPTLILHPHKRVTRCWTSVLRSKESVMLQWLAAVQKGPLKERLFMSQQEQISRCHLANIDRTSCGRDGHDSHLKDSAPVEQRCGTSRKSTLLPRHSVWMWFSEPIMTSQQLHVQASKTTTGVNVCAAFSVLVVCSRSKMCCAPWNGKTTPHPSIVNTTVLQKEQVWCQGSLGLVQEGVLHHSIEACSAAWCLINTQNWLTRNWLTRCSQQEIKHFVCFKSSSDDVCVVCMFNLRSQWTV